MKKLACVAIVLALSVVSANAAIITTAPDALQLTLNIDALGNATIQNTNNGTNASVSWDSYEIWSASGILSPTGWKSISDYMVLFDYGTIIANLGAGAMSFGELKAQTTLLSEGSLSGAATQAYLGTWSVGRPMLARPALSDLSFYYTKPGQVGNKYKGLIVPEPASMSLLLIGGLGLISRRRR